MNYLNQLLNHRLGLIHLEYLEILLNHRFDNNISKSNSKEKNERFILEKNSNENTEALNIESSGSSKRSCLNQRVIIDVPNGTKFAVISDGLILV